MFIFLNVFFYLTVIFSFSIVLIAMESWCCESPCKPNCNKIILCRRGGGHSSSKSWRLSSFHPLFYPLLTIHSGNDKHTTLPPQIAPSTEISALKAKLSYTMEEIRVKNSNLTVHDLKRLLFRCAATLISLKKVRLVVSGVTDWPMESNRMTMNCCTIWLPYLLV